MRTKSNKQIIWAITIFVIIFTLANLGYVFSGRLIKQPILTGNIIPQKNQLLKKVNIPKKLNIKVALVGDLMLDRGVKYSVNKNFGGDYGELFSKVKEELQGYDFLVANLEGPVSDKGVNTGDLYSFRMDPVVLPVLVEVGFDAFSLANNHILNYGPDALADTKIRLKESNIKIAGPETISLDGIKLVILPFNEFAKLEPEEMKEEISLAKATNDLVITFFHFGEEYQTTPNDYQKKMAELAIDAGADLVVGAHPHVVQTLEQYKNVYIMYSLGNFIFDQYFSPETMSGGLLEVVVGRESKKIEKVTLKKVQLNKKYQIESIE